MLGNTFSAFAYCSGKNFQISARMSAAFFRSMKIMAPFHFRVKVHEKGRPTSKILW